MLLDTSGLYCYLDRAERRHGDAATLFEAAENRITQSYVLVELVTLCQARRLDRRKVLSFVADLMENPVVEVIWVDETLHRTALAFLQAQFDKSYSLCDAVSILLMRARGIREALTTDRHFEQAGFVRLLTP